MADIPDSPLTQAHFEQLKNALDIVGRTERQIELAKRAGVDLGDTPAQLADVKTKLSNIRQVYFPGQ